MFFLLKLPMTGLTFVTSFPYLHRICYIYFAGPEMLLRQSSDLREQERVNTNFGGDTGDAFEAHEWRYVRTFNGIFNYLYYSRWTFEASYFSCLICSIINPFAVLCFWMVTQLYFYMIELNN
jgi:hypothetical protein